MIACEMFRLVLISFCLAQQWTFSHGQWADRLSSVSKSNNVQVDRTCKMKDTCTCVRNNGSGINLHDLDTAPKPRFTIKAQYGFLIQWNPCTGYTINEEKDVAVAYGVDKADLFPFGLQKTANFYIVNNTDVIEYTTSQTASKIFLYCDEKVKPILMSISEEENFLVAAYQGPCTLKPKADKSISTGSLIVIAFFVILIVYFTIGCVVNVYARKAEGYERIPNYNLWSALPSLIKDGFVFTFCRNRHKSGYGEI